MERKKRERRGRSNCNWPADLVTEILLKLPVKSIIRFKCVAKTWYHLFKSPTFVSRHLRLSKRKTRFVVQTYADANDDNIVMRLFDDQTLVPCHALLPQPPHHIADKNGGFSFSADNGLVCLWDIALKFEMTLWNPATREFRILPECSLNKIPANPALILKRHLGFGLDPISNDYKVICIQRFVDGMLKVSCAVYRMSTDCWRVMDKEEVEMFRCIYIHELSNKPCVNGVHYWKVSANTSHSALPTDKLLAFHFGNEVFQLIQLPPGTIGHLHPFHDNRISYLSPVISGRHYVSYELWVLNDEEEQQWTKVLGFEHLSGVARVLNVWWKSNKALVESVDGKLLLWDIDAKECRDFGIETRGILQVWPYQESLVAIGRD